MVRSVIYAFICLGLAVLAALMSFNGPNSPEGNVQRWFGASAWISVGGLLLSAVLCLVAAKRRKIPALLVLAAPVVSMLLAAVGWCVLSGNVGEVPGDALSFEAQNALLAQQAHSSLLVPAWGLLLSGLCFVGSSLAAGCARADEGTIAPPDRLRWAWLVVGVVGAGGAVAAVYIEAMGYLGDSTPHSVSLLSELLRVFARDLPLTAAIIVLAALPAFLLPIGRRVEGLTAAEMDRLASARALASAALVGGIACLSLAAPLTAVAQVLETMSPFDGSRSPLLALFPLFVVRQGVQSASPFLVGSAAVVAVLVLLRLRLWRMAWPVVVVVVAVGAVIGLQTLADSRVRERLGGACEAQCTCRHLIAAAALRQWRPSQDQMDPCQGWWSCFDEQESSELQLARIRASQCPSPATIVDVTKRAILVDGHRVVDVQGGAVNPSNKRDGATDYYISPLFDALHEAAENQKLIARRNSAVEFDGEVLLRIDRRSRSRLVTEVMYTAGQAGFDRISFLVVLPEVTDRSPYRILKIEPPSSSWSGRDPSEISGRGKRNHDEGQIVGHSCVGIEVSGPEPCRRGHKEFLAEEWVLLITEDRLCLRSSKGQTMTGATLPELHSEFAKISKGRRAIRALTIRSTENLPFSTQLEAYADLVSAEPDTFAVGRFSSVLGDTCE